MFLSRFCNNIAVIFFSRLCRLSSDVDRSVFLLLASFLYVKRHCTAISGNVPIRIKSWPNDKLTADSSSNGTKWSVKLTKTIILVDTAWKNEERKVGFCSILILRQVYFNQCILEFRVNNRYVIYWKKIFTLSKYYNERVQQ